MNSSAETASRAFPLIRHFIVWSVITTILVTVGLSLIFSEEIKNELMNRNLRYAELVAEVIQRQVQRDFLPVVEKAERGFDMDDPRQHAALERAVREAIKGLHILNVYFFSPDKTIIYSTKSEHIGLVARRNTNLDRALKGEANANLLNRGDPLDLTKSPFGKNLLESYLPARLFGEGQGVGGVIEIYQDADLFVASLKSSQKQVAMIAVIAMAVLFLCNSFIVRKGAMEIQRGREHARTYLAELEQANSRLEELTQNLEEKVQAASRELLRAERLAAVGTLAAGMAHEVNTPLASIATCAQGLLRKESLEGEETRNYLRIIKSQAFRCKEITRNMLDLARRDSPTDAESFDLVKTLRETLEFLTFDLNNKGLSIDDKLPEGPVLVKGKADEIRQVLLNVLGNAMDASSKGDAIHIRLERKEQDSKVVLTIEDDGAGIAREALDKVLDPFFTTKEPGQGTGLGLSLSYAIVRRHQGSMEIASPGTGKGAKVTVSLPGGQV